MFKPFLASIFLVFVSCATPVGKNSYKKVNLNHTGTTNIVTHSFMDLFSRNGQVVQVVEYQHKNGEEKKAQVIFQKGSNKMMSVSVLSLFGMEIMSLEFDGKMIKKKSGLPGIKLDYFDRVMSDMLTIYSSESKLKNILTGDITIKDGNQVRTLKHNNKDLISIIYSSRGAWPKSVEFIQHDLGYKLNIKTVSVKYENLH
jgi:hypothetical protein